MTRTEILAAADQAVSIDRAETYGDAEVCFALIAGHWNWWLGDRISTPITAYDVAQMMVGLKQARARVNPLHEDNHVDQVAYGSLAGEIATAGGDA